VHCHNGSIAQKVSPQRQAGVQASIEGAIENDDPPHQQVESLHPNHSAQLGLRNCLRQFWNDGAVRTI